jgi:hypothetical protein
VALRGYARRVSTTTRTGRPVEHVLAERDWVSRHLRHEAAVDALVEGHLGRRRAGVRHPVEDFLFTYYTHRPAQLRRWHPGVGVALVGDPPHAGWRGYERGPRGVRVAAATVRRLEPTVQWVRALLTATAARPPRLGCFGLHEWAMVYRAGAEGVRHAGRPLRLGADGTDAVVESLPVACSHFDAYRFFTSEARPLNALRPTREDQAAQEHPGCLHATMDLYKWSYKITPLLPSELVLDCFRLAREVRELDMRASPYDLADLGYPPVRVETPEGRAEYVRAQRAFACRGQVLRGALLVRLGRLDVAVGDGGPQSRSARPTTPRGCPHE